MARHRGRGQGLGQQFMGGRSLGDRRAIRGEMVVPDGRRSVEEHEYVAGYEG